VNPRPPILAFALLLTAVCCAEAQDKIYLRRDADSDVFATPGEVLDYTGRTIQFKTGAGIREEPSELVVDIDTKYPEAFVRGQTHFDAGDFDTAKAEWQDALKAESRPWVQRRIRSWLIRCAWRTGDWTTAGNRFLEITSSDSLTPYWSVAPLVWAPTNLRPVDRMTAKAWLEQESPIAKLLGASWLLMDATSGEAANRALSQLARDGNPRVSALARIQLWRRRLGTPPSDSDLRNWRGEIKALPESCRGGPQYLLGRGLVARSEYDLAAAELLWAPLVDNQHEPTAARAMFDASEALASGGRTAEAIQEFQETAARYPWSPLAVDAKSRAKELQAELDAASQ
jgi:hypothetical protein